MANFNTVFKFDRNDYITVPISSGVYSDFTIEAWVFRNDWSDISARREFASIPDDVAGSPLDFGYNSSGELSHWRGAAAGEVATGYNLSGEAPGWHHVAYTQERTSASNVTVKMYWDGALVETMSGNWEDADFSNGSLFIGDNSSLSFGWFGNVSDLRFWSDVRTQSEIDNNKDVILNGNEANLVGYWKINEGTGTTVNDSVSSGGTNGTLTVSSGSWLSYVGQWEKVADTLNGQKQVQMLAELNGKIYGCTRSQSGEPSGRLFEWDESGEQWIQVAPELNSQDRINGICVYEGEIYGTTDTSSVSYSSGRLFKWNGTDAWVQVAPNLNGVRALGEPYVFDSKIYAGTYDNSSSIGARLYEWNGTDAWVQVAPQYSNHNYIVRLVEYNNELYGGTYDSSQVGDLIKWNGVDAWTAVVTSAGDVSQSFVRPHTFNNKLYYSTGSSLAGRGELYEYDDDVSSTKVASQYGSETNVQSMANFNATIYGVTYGNGYLISWNRSDSWILEANKYASETNLRGIIVFNNEFYAGSEPNGYLLKYGDLPVCSTDAVTNIDETTATANGELVSVGSGAISERGFCYNSTGEPNIADDTKVVATGIGTGIFSYDLTGLSENTTYYIRAYATNSDGTGYGSVVSFTTDEGYSVTTDSASNTKATTSTLNGTVNSTLYATSERGFVYGTSTSPDIYSDTKVTSGSGAGSFDEDITGLLPNTTYYVRAYSKYYDESGVLQVEYGDNVSFTTDTLYGRLKYHNGTEWVLYPRPPQGTENQVTVTDNLDTSYTFSTPQDIHTGATPTFVSALLSGLTASRLVATDGAKTLESVTNLANFISGTTNQITISDDGDGTITVSTPQDIHAGATPTFVSTLLSGLTANRLVSTDGTKTLESIADLTAWIAGTDGNLTVTDDGDGTVTLKSIGSVVNVTTLTDTDTLTVPQQGAIKCNKATAMTVNLPTASGNTGLSYFISNVNTGTVTIDTNGAETIQGDATFDLYQDETLNIVSDGTNWILR